MNVISRRLGVGFSTVAIRRNKAAVYSANGWSFETTKWGSASTAGAHALKWPQYLDMHDFNDGLACLVQRLRYSWHHHLALDNSRPQP